MLNIYKASAGSGKTYSLAGEFILESFRKQTFSISQEESFNAFDDATAFSRILAVTFTNKAAGEMKERIIRELDNLSLGLSKDYADRISKKYNLSQQEIIKRALKIRNAILHNYSDFNLKTIDSFVQRVLRSFCYDININSGFSTISDEAVVLSDLTDMLFKLSDNDKYLKKQLLSLAEKNIKDGVNWNFRTQVETIAKLIFSEKYKEFEMQRAEMKENGMSEEKEKDFFNLSNEMVNAVYDNFLSKASNISKRAAETINNICKIYGTSYEDLGKDVKNLCSFIINKLSGGELSDTAIKMSDNDNNWLNKKPTTIQKTVVPVLRDKLFPILSEAVDFIEKNGKDFLTAKIIRKDFNAFILIGEIAKLLPEYRKENRVIMISDAAAFLDKIISGNDAPFIYEKTGNRFDHIFIDEFQDTSPFQWNNFRPLIENSISQGFFNMIVGDVKQAIYRFRGGDWSLLNSGVQSQIPPNNIQINSLEVNYRSKKNIIDFNNAIFLSAVETIEKHSDKDLDLDFQELNLIYSGSYQKLPKDKNRSGGKVNTVFFEEEKNSEEETFKIKALTKVAQEINLLIKNGVKAKKICVLVRKKDEAAATVKFLMQYQNQTENAAIYDVISSDSLYVANSLAVKVMVNAMKYFLNKEDKFAKAEMLRNYCVLKNKNIGDEIIFNAVNDETFLKEFMPKNFEDFFSLNSDLPLYDISEKISVFFDLDQEEGDLEYLRTFQDCVLNFTRQYSSDLNKFVLWWEQSGIKTAIQPSDNQDAVNVMTVHKSKGLDFSIVFVPFCNWKMEDVNSLNANYIWVEAPKESCFKSLPPMPVKYSSQMLKTYFKDFYVKEKRNLYADSLNLLYVALTRAVDELHIYCQKPDEKTNKITTVSDLLYYAITEEKNKQTKEETISLSEFYNSDSLELLIDKNHNLQEGRKANDRTKGFKLKSFKNFNWEDRLQIKTNSSDFFIEQSTFLQERINYGLFMHEVFSQIETLEDYPQVLSDMKLHGRITQEQLLDLTQKLEDAFSVEIVKNWFSKDWKEILTERALLTQEGDIRIPDRVLIGETQTVVIDFKFGKELEEYKNQIIQYATLLKKMKYKNIKAYLFYVEQKKIVEVPF